MYTDLDKIIKLLCIIKHTGGKPDYCNCNYCDNTFTDNSNLVKHI